MAVLRFTNEEKCLLVCPLVLAGEEVILTHDFSIIIIIIIKYIKLLNTRFVWEEVDDNKMQWDAVKCTMSF